MKVEYRSDLQNSYLVLIIEHQESEESYALRMITENQISGLLICERKRLNNDILYYYDVTSKISLEERCKLKKIQGQEILMLLSQFLKVLLKLEEYLLNENSICMLPQYIYIDEAEEKVHFCYVPSETWDLETQLRELMEYLLPYLEHGNQESMMIGYGIYHYILREKFSVDGLYAQLGIYQHLSKEMISKEGTEKAEKKETVEESSADVQCEELWNHIWEEDKENTTDRMDKTSQKSLIVTCSAIVVVVWGLVGWFLWRNFADFMGIWAIVGVIVIVIVSAIKIRKYVGKREKPAEEMIKNDLEEAYTEILNFNLYNNEKFALTNTEQTIALSNKEIFLIGRDEKQADIILPSTVVSRKHAQIRIEKDKCYLTDLYSKNGIRVNGIPIQKGEEIELVGGEEIEFADVVYSFRKEN